MPSTPTADTQPDATKTSAVNSVDAAVARGLHRDRRRTEYRALIEPAVRRAGSGFSNPLLYAWTAVACFAVTIGFIPLNPSGIWLVPCFAIGALGFLSCVIATDLFPTRKTIRDHAEALATFIEGVENKYGPDLANRMMALADLGALDSNALPGGFILIDRCGGPDALDALIPLLRADKKYRNPETLSQFHDACRAVARNGGNVAAFITATRPGTPLEEIAYLAAEFPAAA